MVSGALTRVRNNQVYNSDIDAATKLKPYSITGGLWANSLSYAGNLTIGGNLTINGTTETLDATNLVIADPLLVLNRNQSGTPTYDVGIVMGRGNSTNTAFIWEEGNKQFQLQYTTETTAGATLGAINNSGYANLQAYGVLLNNATITTASITTATLTNSIVANTKTTGGYIDGTSIGSITPNAGVFTSVTTSAGGQVTGYITGAIGANSANTGAFTTLNASGVTTLQNNVFVTGNIIPAANVTYDLGNSTARWRSLYLSGSTLYLNTVALKDSAGTLSVYDSTGTNQASLTAASINATVIGNATPTAATFTQGNVNGTLYAATVNAGTIGNAGAAFSGASSTLTGASQAASFTTSGGGQVSGYLTGALGANSANTVVATSVTTTAGGQVTGYLTGTIGANAANSGAFTAVTTSGTLVSQGTITGAGQIIGYLNGAVGANTANTGAFTTVTTTGSLTAQGTISAPTVQAGTIGNTGAVFTGTSITTSGTSQSASYTTTGGGQVSGYITGAIGANTANTGAFTTVTTTGALTAQGTISSPTVNAGTIGNTGAVFTGATLTTTSTISASGTISAPFVQAGTIGNSGAVFTGATLTASGNITAQTANLYAGYVVGNTGVVGTNFFYTNGVSIATTISNQTYTNTNVSSYLPTYNGNVGNLATGNLIPLANTTYYLGNSTLYWANAYANNFNAISQLATPKIQFTVGGASILEDNALDLAIVGPYQISIKPASYQYTFNNTGTLSGPGGIFVYPNGAVYGNVVATGAYWSNGVSFASTITGTYSNANVAGYLPTYSGALTAGSVTTVAGGQITGYLTGAIGANAANSAAFTTLTASGLTTLTNTTDSTSTGSGALVVSGGAGIAKNVFIGGNLTIVGNLTVQGNNTIIGSTDLTVNDSVINLHTYPNLAPWTVNDGRDIGFKLHYFDSTLAGGDNLSFLGRANDTGYLEWYTTGTENASNVFVSGTYGTIKTGELIAANSTAATSPTTGALRVTGGAGVVGNIYAGGQIFGYFTGAIGANTANTGAFTTLSATGTASLSGTVNAAGTINAATVQAATIGNSGAAFTGATVNTTGAITGATNITAGAQVIGYLNGAVGANAANTGSFTTVTTTSTINSQGTISAPTVQAATIGNSGAAFSGATSVLTSTSQAASFTTSGGGQVSGYLTGAIGANTANTGAFTTVTTTSTINSQGTISAPTVQAGTIGNAGAAFTGATVTTTSTISASGTISAPTVQAGTIGNSGAAFSGATSVLTSTSQAASFTTSGGGQVTGYLTGAIGANVANSGAFTTVTATGSITGATNITAGAQVIGYLNGALGANTPNSVVATSVTTSAGGQVTGYLTGAIGANSANTGAFTTITSTSTITSQGTITGAGQIIGYFTGAIGANTANAGTFTSLTTTGSGGNISGSGYVVAGNLVANNNVYAANYLYANGVNIFSAGTYGNTQVGAYLTQYSGVLTAGSLTTVSGGQITGYLTGAIGANSANTGAFTTVTTTGALTSQGTISAPTVNAGSIGNSGSTLTGTIQTASQTNITSVGTLGSLNVTNNISASTITGTLQTASQTNITSVGTLGSLSVTGNASAAWFNGSTGVSSNLAVHSYIQPASGNLNLNSGGDNTNVAINSYGYSANLVVNGNVAQGYQNLLVTNGITGQVGIKTAPGAIVSGASMQITATDSILIPSGTTGQRPTGTAGMVRYNTQTNQFEFFNAGSSAWTGTGSTFTTVTADSFTGDGSTTAFSLSQSTTTSGTLVAINGVIQIPIVAYSVSGTTLTFTEAPLSTDVIDARSIVTTSSVTSLAQANSYVSVADTGGTTANIAVVVNNAARYIANTNGNYFGGGISPIAGNTSCLVNVPTIIDSFDTTVFRGAKYVISVQDYASYNFQMAEVIMVLGNSNATVQTYGVVSVSGTSFCNFYANVSGTTARLYANSSASSFAKVQQIYMPL